MGAGVQQTQQDNFFADDPRFSGLPLGPRFSIQGGEKRIFQTPGAIAILARDLTYRVLFMDGRELEADPNPTWMGYSVARWEGDTLVVESAGFNNRTWLTSSGLPHTEALRMRERYRRRDYGHLDLEVTFTDPGAHKKSWSVEVRMELAVDTEMLEEIWHESPNRRVHWVGRFSDARQSGVKVAPEILKAYIGVYKGPYGGVTRTVEFAVVGSELILKSGGRTIALSAQSNSVFVSAEGLGYEFIDTGPGPAAQVVERHVSGAYTFDRQR